MPSTHAVLLEAFPTRSGCLIRVTGRGTMRESRVCHDYACRFLKAMCGGAAAEDGCLTIDLSECERLDSTFLGSLVDLHKRFNDDGRAPFAVAGPPEVIHELLGCARLDRILPVRREPPATVGEGTPLLSHEPIEARDLGLHVMECHRRLAEQGGPASEAFARIADQLEKELREMERQRGVIE